LLGLDECSQTTDGDPPSVQVPLPDRLALIDQEVAPGGFVLVAGQFRATGELLGMLAPGLQGLEEGKPGVVHLQEYLIAHLAWEGLIGGVPFDLVIDGHVVQIAALPDERLTYQIVGGIPQVFGGKSRRINLAKAPILA
jgi:hypothetical protein